MTEHPQRDGHHADVAVMSLAFAVRIVRTVNTLPRSTAAIELGRQIVRSGTSIGANVQEAQGARTRAEFLNSMSIAKREARETCYWVRVLGETSLLKRECANELLGEADRLVKVLTAIVKTTQERSSASGGRGASITHNP